MSLQVTDVTNTSVTSHVNSLANGINSITELKYHFLQNKHPYWFIHHTPIHAFGLQKAISNLRFLSLVDGFNGQLPGFFTLPSKIPTWNEEVLRREDVIQLIQHYGGKGSAAFVFFNEGFEKATHELGLNIVFPSAAIRQQFDDKCEGNRIAEKVGVKPVPYLLLKVKNYQVLRREAEVAGLGASLVVQTSQGDSGKTTFFIESEEDYQRHAHTIEAEEEVRIMKRLRCRSIAVEGCITSSGILVGAPMNDLVGYPELTPYKGGWCGNEVDAHLFSKEQTDYLRSGTVKIGTALQQRGYWGCFEVDWLLDEDTHALYFGEINPRLSGATPLSNLTSAAIGAPLFLFHLVESEGLKLNLDIHALNQQAVDSTKLESWSSLIIKHVENDPVHLTENPAAGIWTSENESISFTYATSDISHIFAKNQAFWFSEIPTGALSTTGTIWGRLFLRGRVTDETGQLTPRANFWIQAIRQLHRVKA